SHQVVRDSQGLLETFAERFEKANRVVKRPVYVDGKLIGHMLVVDRPSGKNPPLSIQDYYDSLARQARQQEQRRQTPPPQPTQIASPSTEELVAEVLEYVDPPLTNLNTEFQRSLLIAGIASGLAGLLIVSVFTRQALAPIRGLTTAASKLGAGDLSQRVPADRKDEIGDLSRSFNAMATDLESAVVQRKRLTADVAHELRTPLTNIQGYLEAIRDGVVEADEGTIDTLHSQTIHLSKLIEDLRVLAVADAGALSLNLQMGSLAAVVESAVKNFQRRTSEKGVALKFSSETALPNVSFDATRIEQVVTNLIENALTHTSDQGEISIELTSVPTGVALTVTDTGAGIPKDEVDKVFDEFYRTDPSRTRSTGGTGLGLTIVKKLVEAHNGRISVSSIEGEGTTFIVELPTAT
ncbi:MAG: sensor histidine kinase, partial [Dehalococcoidia bacterium]